MTAHHANDRLGNLGQEGAFKADQFAKARCPAQNHAQYIAAPFIAW